MTDITKRFLREFELRFGRGPNNAETVIAFCGYLGNLGIKGLEKRAEDFIEANELGEVNTRCINCFDYPAERTKENPYPRGRWS